MIEVLGTSREQFRWKSTESSDDVKVLPEKLSAETVATIAIILGANLQRSESSGGAQGNASIPIIDAPKIRATAPSKEDQKALTEAVSQFGLLSMSTVFLEVLFALQKMRTGAAELMGNLAMQSEKAVYRQGEMIQKEGFTNGVSTAMQGATQFGITVAGAGMKHRATTKDITNIKEIGRGQVKTVAVKDNIGNRNGKLQQATHKPSDDVLNLSQDPVVGATPLVASAATVDSHAVAMKQGNVTDLVDDTSRLEVQQRLAGVQNSRLHTKSDAVIGMAHTMGTLATAGGGMHAATQRMEGEYDRNAGRILQDSSAQAADSNRNDDDLIKRQIELMLQYMEKRDSTAVSIIANSGRA